MPNCGNRSSNVIDGAVNIAAVLRDWKFTISSTRAGLGDDTEANLITLCSNCHRNIHRKHA